MKHISIFAFLTLLSCLLIQGCASNWTKTYGSFELDPEIRAMFETHDYVSDYNYYYTGYIKSPEAIVGISKEYNLVKKSGWGFVTDWQKFQPRGEKLIDLVEAMRNPGRPFGYNLYAPGGEQIGVLYTSKWGTNYSPEIRLKAGNRLEVTPHKYKSTWAPSA